MTNKKTKERIDSIIKHEVDDESVTITDEEDYEALRVAFRILQTTETI